MEAGFVSPACLPACLQQRARTARPTWNGSARDTRLGGGGKATLGPESGSVRGRLSDGEFEIGGTSSDSGKYRKNERERDRERERERAFRQPGTRHTRTHMSLSLQGNYLPRTYVPIFYNS